MSRARKTLMVRGISCLLVGGAVSLLAKSFALGTLVTCVLLFLATIRWVPTVLNERAKRTNWYKNQLGDGAKFCKEISCELDICNLGSNSGKYAFSYEGTGLKGENWAVGPQTLSYDFRVLKNYSSYLRDGAVVLIPLSPFSSCLKDYEDDKANHKYYSFLHPVLIVNYSRARRDQIKAFVEAPLRSSPLMVIVRLIKDAPAADKRWWSVKSMDEANLEKDADRFLSRWKEQFSIADLEAPMSERHRDCLAYNAQLLAEMIAFCLERNLKPVLVLPPITKALSARLSAGFREAYVYAMVRKGNLQKVPFLDYLDDARVSDNKLFVNSFFLNAKGRKIFTQTVLQHLKQYNDA